MNILVCCSSGMSSSILVRKLREEVKNNHLEEIRVGACSLENLALFIKQTDYILVSPQLSFRMETIQSLIGAREIPIYEIAKEDFGEMNAKKILLDFMLFVNSEEEKRMDKSNAGKFSDKLQSGVVRFSNNLVIKTIANGMLRILPITIIGSIAVILLNLEIPAWKNFLENSGLSSIIGLGSALTTDIITIYVILALATEMANNLKKGQLESIMFSMMSFFMLTPIAVFEVGDSTTRAFELSLLGSKGMFVGMLVALTVPYLYAKLIDLNLTIKLPESVPPMISRTFSSLIPGLIIAVVTITISGLFQATAFGNIHNCIYTLLQTPLQGLGASIFTMLFIVFFGEILWFFGIHGSGALGAITSTLYLPPSIENINAYADGIEMPNILTESFLNVYKGPRHLALALLLVIVCRSIQLKSVGKISVVPGLFGISEPMKFGIPMVLNPLIFVPMTLAPVFSIGIAYVATIIGFLPKVGVTLPWAMPPIVSGILAGGWQGAFIQIIQFIAIIALYLPFLKALDKQKVTEENVVETKPEEKVTVDAISTKGVEAE
ncbi:PTS transporter subunit EIIC [Candidatus Enterococcus clewellii]|uniref:PTS system lactose-specific EIICB component n=1 Tax=Candidatus Enterococcus clewellii TaxID=1834193 RepID=A0A242K542_9ENTE|nr:PTS transporter subunit EIIC [Enterococcus sp. 9E7_DIV0242]OTP14565.1 PTS system, cellobiose-specific IIC component [Enterococcus sp. 9E7_DIV0242]